MIVLHIAGTVAADPASAVGLGSWQWRPAVVGVIAALGTMYIPGWLRLRRRSREATQTWQLAAYLVGLLALAGALLSPIDGLADRLLAMHMVQHELLTMVAAPLLLLGNPLVAALWALPHPLRTCAASLLAPGSAVRLTIGRLTFMPVAWTLYMGVLGGWHIPAAYEAALHDPALHDIEHLSFFAAAVLFWWPVVNPAPRLRALPIAFRLVYLAAAAAFTMAPAIIVGLFVRTVIYPHYATVPSLWGLSALDDQALGWGLMGVIDALVYFAAFMTLVARMALREQRMTELEEALQRRSRPADAGLERP